MLYLFILLCALANTSSTAEPVPSGSIDLSPEIYVENTDVHIDPKGECQKEIGLMINEAPVYLEISGQSHRINGYYSFGMIDNCGAPFTLEQGSVPSFSTCAIQRCDCNYGVQEWDCVTRQCPAHTVWWQNPTSDQEFSSYQSDVLDPSDDPIVREKYAFIDGYVKETDVVITRLEYDCQASNLNHICQHLFKNIISQVGIKVRNIHIHMPEHNAKDECECALMPLTADKTKWRVLIDSHEHGYMFNTVLFSMPEGSQLDKQEAVLNFCINEQPNYKNRFWKIVSKEQEIKCAKPICPFSAMQACPPNSEWSKRQCPMYDECCKDNYEQVCPCCVSATDNKKCIDNRKLQMIRPQQVVRSIKKHTGLIICVTLIVLVTAVTGLIFKSQNKPMNPRNRRNTFGEYIPDSKPDLSVRAQTFSSRRLLEDDFENGTSFHALIDDSENANGLEPVAMT